MLSQPQFQHDDATGQTASETINSDRPIMLDIAIDAATQGLINHQQSDGHWVYELEADCTIPAEYILMNHFLDEIDDDLEQKIGNFLREKQLGEGGWPLFEDGDVDLSCSVKSYFALKIIGDDPAAPHMVKARNVILNHGGAARSNVFTRILMAMFEQVPWRAVPFIPAEVILLPKWFPFHISKVAYWSRTVMVPLFVLCTMKGKARNPRGVYIRELFITPPNEEQHYFRVTDWLTRAFLILDHVGMLFEKLVPKFMRKYAIEKCKDWFVVRMNEDHGIGGIFPAMVNVNESLAILGYDKEHPLRQQARKAIDKLLVIKNDSAYCQPCASPVWDTALACQALSEVTRGEESDALTNGLQWLVGTQLSDEPGDWRLARPNLAGGGWAFQYSNYYYPDLDDTSMAAWAMHRVNHEHYAENIARASVWVAGMQSKNGGFGSFEVDNTQYYLNSIPFADHGALLDPPTADVTGRVIALMTLKDKEKYAPNIKNAFNFLKQDQEEDGSWFGRWGTNYIYGTWSVLSALELANADMKEDWLQKAVSWLETVQNEDGGWGESNDSYYPPHHPRPFRSTPYQTSWALLALMAAGENDSDAVKRGIDWLISRQQTDGLWDDRSFTAPGFPRVFFLRYHGYNKFFPLWTLARYRNQQDGITV